MYFLNALQCRLIMAFGVSSAWGRVLIFAGWGLCKLQKFNGRHEWHLRKQPIISEVRFRAIFEQINVGICQADLDGYLVDANPGLCHMLGYSHDELVHRKFQQITHPADLNADLEEYEKLLQGHQNSMFVEKRYLHKDGHAIWVALTVCLVRDALGQPLYSIGVSQDISDRKAAELTLKASHQHVTDILESITDAFFCPSIPAGASHT